MKIPFYRNKDILSGLMFIVVGGLAIIIARDYPFGSSLRMGPGYFPTVLGGIMITFGIIVLIQGLITPNKIERTWSVRALIILPISAVVYGILMETAGFIPALLVLTMIAATASPKFKFLEQAILSLALCAISVALFIYGLGLPYPLIGGH